MKKFAKWLVMILVVSCICALTLFATGCGEKAKSVKSINVNDKGEIVAVYDDDSVATLGNVGFVKSAEVKGDKFVLTLSDGKTIEVPVASTTVTKSVVAIEKDGNVLKITYSDKTTGEIKLGEDSVVCDHKNAHYVEEVKHTMKADKTFTNGVYLMLCPDCGYAYTFVGVRHELVETPHPATCTEDGYIAKECECGYQAEVKDGEKALGHDWQAGPVFSSEHPEDWCVNGGWTAETCARCGAQGEKNYWTDAKDAKGHISDAWTVSSKPEYNKVGTLSGVCKVCGKTVTKSIPACKDAAYTVSGITPEHGSCAEAKKGTFTMTVDGQEIVVKDVTIPGTLHTLNGKLVDLTANDGVLLFADEAAFKATGITLFADEKLGCGAAAKAMFTCEACEMNVLTKVQLKHVRPADAEPTTEPTCETAGEYTFNCSVCGGKDVKEAIPALGHNYKYDKPVKVDDGYTLHAKCQRTGCDKEVYYTNLKSVVEKITEATCQKEGNTHYDVVTADGESIEIDSVIPKLAHTLKKADGTKVKMPARDDNDKFIKYSYADYKDDITWFADTEFKCTNDNINGSYVCDVCTESVLCRFVVDHVAAEGEGKITPATCETAAIRAAYTCTVCGNLVPEEVVGEALGHDKVYSNAVENAEGKWVVSISCKREGCKYTNELVFDEKPTTTVIVPATCTSTGTTLYVGKVGGVEKQITVITSKIGHTLNGKAEYITGDVVKAGTPGLVIFADQAPACKDGATAQGHFQCEACKQYILVNVKSAHTKPVNIPDDKDHKLAATCDHYGWIKYNCAKCGAEETEYVDALGHDLTAEVKDGKIVVKCVTEGCTATFDPIDLPATDKMTLVDSKAATCGEEGFKKYTFDYTYTYTVTNYDEKTSADVTKEMKKDFTELVYVETLAQSDHRFIMTTDEAGNEIVLVVAVEIVKGEGEDAKTYIVKYKICADCGRRILVSATVKPAEDPTV